MYGYPSSTRRLSIYREVQVAICRSPVNTSSQSSDSTLHVGVVSNYTTEERA